MIYLRELLAFNVHDWNEHELGCKMWLMISGSVVGHDWRFMTLEGKQYAISQDYSSITDDVFDVFRILKALKTIIIELTA